VVPTLPAEFAAVLSVLIGILATPFTGLTGLTVGSDTGEPILIPVGAIAEDGLATDRIRATIADPPLNW
jgi:hypothetical protein